MNSCGLSVAMRSDAHGTIPVPTLKGLNHFIGGYRLGSTPSRSDLSADCYPGWRLLARHPGLSILVPSGDERHLKTGLAARYVQRKTCGTCSGD